MTSESTAPLAAGYRLGVEPPPPPLDDSLRLRRDSGSSPERSDQGQRAVAGSWSAVHVVDVEGVTVAMDGRALGFEDVAPSLGMALPLR